MKLITAFVFFISLSAYSEPPKFDPSKTYSTKVGEKWIEFPTEFLLIPKKGTTTENDNGKLSTINGELIEMNCKRTAKELICKKTDKRSETYNLQISEKIGLGTIISKSGNIQALINFSEKEFFYGAVHSIYPKGLILTKNCIGIVKKIK